MAKFVCHDVVLSVYKQTELDAIITKKSWPDTWKALKANLMVIPTVELVRCKDCKHYKPQSKSAHWNSKALYCCRSATVKMKPDDFCSCGERRDNEKG